MVFLRCQCFSTDSYHKVQARKFGPCHILRKISDNAYQVELLAELHISNTFNVVDIFPYHPPYDAPVNKDGGSKEPVGAQVPPQLLFFFFKFYLYL